MAPQLVRRQQAFLWRARLGFLCCPTKLCRPVYHGRATFWSLGRPPSIAEAYECEIRILHEEHRRTLESTAFESKNELFSRLRESIEGSVPGVNTASYPSSSKAVLAGMKSCMMNSSGAHGEDDTGEDATGSGSTGHVGAGEKRLPELSSPLALPLFHCCPFALELMESLASERLPDSLPDSFDEETPLRCDFSLFLFLLCLQHFFSSSLSKLLPIVVNSFPDLFCSFFSSPFLQAIAGAF